MLAFLFALCAAGSGLSRASENEPGTPPAASADVAPRIEPGSGWLLDLERAKAAAREGGKDILINFSGSDWCPPCIVLEEQIFSKEAFIRSVTEDFILLNLDFPRHREKQSEALRAMVDQAVRDYGITAYPTIILTDSRGRPYARTGFKQMDLDEYAEHLRSLAKERNLRDIHLAAAEQSTGPEKAKHIATALGDLPPSDILTFYEPEYRAALAADPEGAGGMQHVVYFERKSALEQDLDRYAETKNWYAVLARIERFLRTHKNLTPAQRQEVEFFKTGSLVHLADFDELEQVLNTVVNLDPESPLAEKSKQFLAAVGDLRKRAAEIEKARDGKATPRRPAPAPKKPAAAPQDK